MIYDVIIRYQHHISNSHTITDVMCWDIAVINFLSLWERERSSLVISSSLVLDLQYSSSASLLVEGLKKIINTSVFWGRGKLMAFLMIVDCYKNVELKWYLFSCQICSLSRAGYIQSQTEPLSSSALTNQAILRETSYRSIMVWSCTFNSTLLV